MRTGHWIIIVGSLLGMSLFACASQETGGTGFQPAKEGGVGGGPVGKGGGGGSAKGGSDQGGSGGGDLGGSGGSNEGGSSGEGGSGGSNEGGSGGNNQGGSNQGGSNQGGTGGGSQGGSGGTSQGGSGGSGGGSCDNATKGKSTDCENCYNQDGMCTTEMNACKGDTDCQAFVACAFPQTGTCDDACIADCQSQHLAGATLAWKYIGCLDVTCHDSCRCTDCSLFKAGACGDCVEQNCMTQCSACASSSACLGVWNCVSYCAETDTTCQQTCAESTALSSGWATLLALIGNQNSCVGDGACATPCQ